MSVRTDQVNLIINVNGSKAQNELNELRKKAADLTYEMKTNLKKGTQEYIAAAADLKKVNADMSELKKTMGIAALTLKELRAEQNKLKAAFASTTPNSADYKEYEKQLKAVKNRIYEVENNVSGLGAVFSKVKDEVKQFGVLMLGFLGFQFLTSQFKNIISGAGKLSDSLADIRRVAGLTNEEVLALNTTLSKIDTRTSMGGLREIAIIAGKLGVAKNDIAAFTKAVDMLVVTLGDELGDADAITATLGKILNVFDGEVTGDNVTKLGNAFVKLANSGVATGGWMADFVQRLSGIAKSSGITLGSLTGLGAGLEELGGRVESSATAIQKLLINMARDLPKAAEIAGETAEDFKKLFQIDPQEALLRYSEGLTKNKAGFDEIVASFKDAGEEGARVIETLTKMGTSGALLRDRIRLGNEAIQETSAIYEGFALKNETLGATLDKLGKEFYKLVYGSGVTTWLNSVVEGAVSLIKWLKDLPTFIRENRIALSLLITAMIAMNRQLILSNINWALSKAAIMLETAAKAAGAIATLAYRAVTLSFAAAQALATGNITRATAAMRLLNLAFKASPIGALLTALVALGVALDYAFSKTSRLQKAQADLSKQAIDNYGDEVNKIETLKKALESSTTSYEQKKKILQELIAINPEFAETLRLNADGHLSGVYAIEEYIKSLKRKGEAEAAQSLSNEQNKEIIKLQQKKEAWEKSAKFSEQMRKKMLGDLDLQIAKLQEVKDFYDEKIIGAIKTPITFFMPADTVPGGKAAAPDPSVAARKAQLEKLIKETEDAYQRLNATDRKGQATNLALQRKYRAEMDALMGVENKKGKSAAGPKNTEFDRLKKEAEQFYTELQKLKREAENASLSGDEKELMALQDKYDALHKKALEYFKKNATSRAQYTAQEKLIIESFNKELEDLQKKQFGKYSEEEYAKSLEATKGYFEAERLQAEKNYADLLLTKEDYEQELLRLDMQEKEQMVIVAEGYVGTVKKAEGDLLKFKIVVDKAATTSKRTESEKQIEFAKKEATARAKLAVLATPEGSNDRRQAQKKFLDDQFKEETAALSEFSEQYKLKKIELNTELAEIDKAYTLSLIEAIESWANQLMSITSGLFQVLDNMDVRRFNKEKALNEAKKNNYKQQLDGKLMSQKQYDAKVAAADEELDRKKKEMELKAFKRKQALGIAEVLISGAAAIAKTFAEFGWPIGIPMAAAMAITTGLQVAAIATQSPPEMGEGGLIKNGPYHGGKSNGLPLINPETGKTELLLEKDEGVVKGKAMRDKEKYTVTGTPSQIASKLNALHGGVNWASGAVIQMNNRPRPELNPNLPRIMEQGGIIRPLDPERNQQASGETDSLLRTLIAKHDELIDEVKNQKDRLHAVVSIKEYRAMEKKYDNAKKAGGMDQ